VGSSADVIGRGSVPALTPSTYAQNQLAYEVSQWTPARARYRACLDLDPAHAPAWARLARCERLIEATAMFRRAHGPEMLECVTAPRSL